MSRFCNNNVCSYFKINPFLTDLFKFSNRCYIKNNLKVAKVFIQGQSFNGKFCVFNFEPCKNV